MQPHQSLERKSRPRQEPVSCQSCRVKKLKCSRQQPCSNCLARGVTCQSQFRQPTSVSPRQQEAATEATTSGDSDSAAILARLKRVEDLLSGLSRTQIPPPQSDGLSSQSVDPSPRSDGDETSRIDSDWLEDVGFRTKSLVGVILSP
jgi:Fungal Zn(2)-Cys(6) binuclear cluster domain